MTTLLLVATLALADAHASLLPTNDPTLDAADGLIGVDAAEQRPAELRLRGGTFAAFIPEFSLFFPAAEATVSLLAYERFEFSIGVHAVATSAVVAAGLHLQAGFNHRHDLRSADGKGCTVDVKAVGGVELLQVDNVGLGLLTGAFMVEKSYWLSRSTAVTFALSPGVALPLLVPYVTASVGVAFGA